MGLDKLTQWTGPTTSFRPSAKYGEADATALKGRSRSAVWADSDTDLGRASAPVDGGAIVYPASDDENGRPPERLNVYKMGGSWRSADGVLRGTNHKFNSEAAYARAEIVLLTSSLWREAGALALMADGRHDVRPHILLLFHGQDLTAFPAVLAYGINYLDSWCHANGVILPLRARHAAARDALDLLWARRAGVNVNLRAKELGVRSSGYRELRGVAIRLFQRRLKEAEQRFNDAMA